MLVSVVPEHQASFSAEEWSISILLFQEDLLMARFFGFRSAALGLFLCITLFFSLPAASADTIARFDTSLGSFDVQLYDTATPITVQNFLAYVTSGRYQDSFIHRSVTDFIVQGGGFTYDHPYVEAVPAFDPIVNEFDPSRSNVRGTIAMAKTSDPDSATSQFFFNLSDNSASLDNPSNSGGFTVFGEVLGDGMDVVDAIAAVDTFVFASPFSEMPLRNYTQDDYDNFVPITDDNVVFVNVSVPEPTTLGLLTVGGLAMVRRRRKK